LPFGLHMHANWLLLAGIAALIGGGLLIQITWNN
jgi:LPXTG-motif cell wall-anchored protein